jgi:outer membrane protein TolC
MIPHVNAFAEVALDTDEMFKRKGESWTAGAVLTWDLFSGGKSIGAVREAKSAHEGARAMAAFKASDVVREVRVAFRNAGAANAQVDISEDGLKHAEERLRITQLQYQEGLATSIDLLTAESELRRARVRRLQALHALNVGLAALEHAVGE